MVTSWPIPWTSAVYLATSWVGTWGCFWASFKFSKRNMWQDMRRKTVIRTWSLTEEGELSCLTILTTHAETVTESTVFRCLYFRVFWYFRLTFTLIKTTTFKAVKLCLLHWDLSSTWMVFFFPHEDTVDPEPPNRNAIFFSLIWNANSVMYQSLYMQGTLSGLFVLLANVSVHQYYDIHALIKYAYTKTWYLIGQVFQLFSSFSNVSWLFLAYWIFI